MMDNIDDCLYHSGDVVIIRNDFIIERVPFSIAKSQVPVWPINKSKFHHFFDGTHAPLAFEKKPGACFIESKKIGFPFFHHSMFMTIKFRISFNNHMFFSKPFPVWPITLKLNHAIFAFFILTANSTLHSQNEEAPKWQFRGYLKSLQTTSFVKIPPLSESIMFNDHLLHNRLNLKWFPNENFTLTAELRNRLFWGDQVRFNPGFIKNANAGSDDFFDWSAGCQNKKGYALHTPLDRFYGEYVNGPWEARLGRQRVNWGIGTTWNPNDIFNAFNFTDFDYEERPGSDALRIKRYTGTSSSLEVAVKAARDKKDLTAAFLGKFHTGTYDWQVLAGVTDNHTVLGGGWAGNLGKASFKGETAWFYPLDDSLNSSYALALGLDYTFPNQMYLNAAALYNSSGSTGKSAADLFAFELSARNLYPYKYSVLAQLSYPFSPLLNGALVVVYSPGGAHAMFLNPVLTASIAANWDVEVVAQVLFQKEEKYGSPVQAGYLRVKWSF